MIRLDFAKTDSGMPKSVPAGRFLAHSAIIAKSGAGKSFLLGRFLEELAIHTPARVAILDPNSDFARFDQVNASCWTNPKLRKSFFPYERGPAFPARFTKEWKDLCLPLANRGTSTPIRLDFGAIPPEKVAPVLGIDEQSSPELSLALQELWRDAENRWKSQKVRNHVYFDYEAFATSGRHFVRFLHRRRGTGFASDVAKTLRKASPTLAFQILALIQAESDVWRQDSDDPNDLPALHEIVAKRRIAAVDLGSLASRDERLLVANALVSELWRDHETEHADALRNNAEPKRLTFLVIDECHNLIPPNPDTPAERLLVSQVTRIAAGGRKYGLFLIVVTQRPRKMNGNVLSECENLFLMRVTNIADLEFLRDQLGYLDPNDVKNAPKLRKGEFYLRGSDTITGKLRAAPRRTGEGGKSLSAELWKEKTGWRA